jgi:hypothetical protein
MRAVFLLLLTATPATAADVAITHDAVGCVVAEEFPEVVARIDPADRVASARVRFRPPDGAHWYSVGMKPGTDGFRAVLPSPKKSLKSFVYYLEATDAALGTTRTPEYTPAVAEGPGACRTVPVAAAAVGEIALESPAGAPAVPAGFNSLGIAGVAGAAAVTLGAAEAVGAGTAGAAATGGGISTPLLVAGAAVAAGGAAAAIAVASSSTDEVVHPGFVYVGACTCGPLERAPPYTYATAGPIQGAVVSTDLNSDTATSDAQGHFELRTTDTTGREEFTIRVTAPGCTESHWRGGFGTNPVSYVTLQCSGGLPPHNGPCNCGQ